MAITVIQEVAAVAAVAAEAVAEAVAVAAVVVVVEAAVVNPFQTRHSGSGLPSIPLTFNQW